MKTLGQIIGGIAIMCFVVKVSFIWANAQNTEPESAVQTEARTMRVTAYCACERCCGQWADGITASGHRIQPGDKFCAAPRSIPFGTMIDIPGYGRVPVLDRGGAIKGRTLDVFIPDHEDALRWGNQDLVCTVSDEDAKIIADALRK